MTRRWIGMASLGVCLVLVACGQYPGVRSPIAGEPGSVRTDPGSGVVVGPDGPVGGGGGGPADPGIPGAPGGGGGAGPAGPTTVTGAGDATGVSGTEILIGIHAPLTGAAPIEARAFEVGTRLYWDWLKANGRKIHGRTVRAVFSDDNYRPSTAVSVCNTMAVSKRAFLLIGAAGTDQINACAQYANPRGIPYLSLGVQEAGVSRLRTYFAMSMTYRQQMPLLVRLLVRERTAKRLPDRNGDGVLRIGYVRPNTPNFTDSAEALRNDARAAGFEYRQYTVVKEGTPAEAETVATQMQQDGIDVVIPITAPLFTIQLAIQAGKKGYFPRYAGVGVSNNINQMINQTCRNDEFNDALFLSPWPGWRNVMHREYDREFRTAAERDADARDVNRRDKGGDIVLALWGLSRSLHRALEAAGPALTRERLIQTMETLRTGTGLFPDLRFTPDNHLGARNAHVLLGRCRQEGGDYGGGGPQWISHPDYPGLRDPV